jgi:hypothetical protein
MNKKMIGILILGAAAAAALFLKPKTNGETPTEIVLKPKTNGETPTEIGGGSIAPIPLAQAVPTSYEYNIIFESPQFPQPETPTIIDPPEFFKYHSGDLPTAPTSSPTNRLSPFAPSGGAEKGGYYTTPHLLAGRAVGDVPTKPTGSSLLQHLTNAKLLMGGG